MCSAIKKSLKISSIHCVAGNFVVLKLIWSTNTKVKISKAKYDLHFLKKSRKTFDYVKNIQMTPVENIIRTRW